MNEIYTGKSNTALPPIQIQPPSMGSVLDMLNVINGILFVQIRYGSAQYNIGLNGKFLRFRRDDVSKPRSFYEARIEKLVIRWETVIANNGNYIIH
jgi:hypothetical protein